MSYHHKLSLQTAILINVNIMLGAGLFINTTVLAQLAGMYGAVSYALIGILMIPLIASIMQLLSLHPAGGFYTFGSKEIHPFAGFLGAWSYATGKLASTIIMIHASMLFLQQIFPILATINTLYLDAGILVTFIALNMFDIQTGSHVQSLFLSLKLIPVFFGILTGMLLIADASSLPTLSGDMYGIPMTLPLVLFAIVGFEAACSLSSRIEDAKQNAPRAVMISYFIIICLNILYQLMISGALGDLMNTLTDYRGIFPSLISLTTFSPEWGARLVILMNLAIVSSALGGSYGIIFSNTWNWYALAQHNHLIGSNTITKFNRFNIPWRCVIIQGAICFLYLLVTRGSQLPLQQTSVLGVTLGYTISVIALIVALAKRTDVTIKPWLAYLALVNCMFLLGTIIYSLIHDGVFSLLTFTSLLVLGVVMFWYTSGKVNEA